jgi:hypothetical protein
MNKPIRSYEDLSKERQRLELLLQAQRELLYYDVQEIKEELQPLRNAIAFVKKITSKDKTSLLLNIGTDIAINSIVKRFILSRAGWVVRTVIPYFLKNYSSHFVAEQKDKWLDKLKHWLSHLDGKKHKEDDSFADKKK